MVIDKLIRMEEYASLLPHMKEALTALEQHKNDAPGRYEFPGGFILIQEGVTTSLDTGDFEVHRNYLDVQVLLEGAEMIEWADICELTCSVPYDVQKDKAMYHGNGINARIYPGMFYVFRPHDAHKACGHVETPTSYRKAVMKLSVIANDRSFLE